MQYEFTLTPQPPSSASVVKSPPVGAPFWTSYTLTADTTYNVTIACTTPEGQRVQGSNIQQLVTASPK